MNYQSLEHYSSLPKEIEEECIQYTEQQISNGVPIPICYGGYETENKKSLSYIPLGEEFLGSNGKETGRIGFYHLPVGITNKILDYYNKLNHPLKENTSYFIQMAIGSNFVGPHIDNPEYRESGLLYLLKAGGSNVRTRWYKIKDEFKNQEITYNIAIPYERLTLVEDHCLKEHTWHWLNFSNPHSVENQETLRIGLSCVSIRQMEELIKKYSKSFSTSL